MNTKTVLAVAIAVALVGSTASASDTKNYGGAHCRANKKVFYQFAQAYNKTNKVLGVECPVVQDAGGTERVDVRVISRNDQTPMSDGFPGVLCSFWTWAGSTNEFAFFVDTRGVDDADDDDVQVLTFPPQSIFASASYKNLFCELPPKLNGNLSGVIQYSVREAES